MEARLENGGSIEKWRLDWKIEARLRNRASFVAEWQNEVSWSFQIESFWSGLPETLSDLFLGLQKCYIYQLMKTKLRYVIPCWIYVLQRFVGTNFLLNMAFLDNHAAKDDKFETDRKGEEE